MLATQYTVVLPSPSVHLWSLIANRVQCYYLQNLLPKIIKVWPETIVGLLERMSRSHDTPADMYLMLASRARTSGLLKEEVEDEERWCGVLSKKLIEDSLHSSSSQVYCRIERLSVCLAIKNKCN